MPRSKGHTKAVTRRLEGIELVQFNLRLMPDELKLVRLRISQAVRRDEGLKDLLDPAQVTIDRLLSWTGEAAEALTRIQIL